jgi:lipopolysaccharide transport system ATP-binding protein
MKDIAIRVENLRKLYRIGKRERYQTLRDTLTDTITAPFRWLRRGTSDNGNAEPDHIWALKDVSFEIPRGEVVGIIGRNGAGKSTLLKVLSRITEPTAGHAEIHGRVGSLLEVGTGFHPELTGRENIYLNGAILGMRKVEITRQFDEIVAFAEIEKFLDTAVKHYSSGMYMRLAFAVAAHLETDILIVDEVLAVGDIEFQKKCLRKMQDVSQGGRSVVFVSHNMGAITRLCARSIWLDQGTAIREGASSELAAEYQARNLHCLPQWARRPSDGPSTDFAFLAVGVQDSAAVPRAVFDSGTGVTVRIDYQVFRPLQACQIGARLYNAEGMVVFTTADSDGCGVSAFARRPGLFSATFTIPGHLLSGGTYYIMVAAHVPGQHVYDAVDQTAVFEVDATSCLSSLDGRSGVVSPLFHWSAKPVPGSPQHVQEILEKTQA